MTDPLEVTQEVVASIIEGLRASADDGPASETTQTIQVCGEFHNIFDSPVIFEILQLL